MDLTDQQWTIIVPLFEEKRRPDGRGLPWRDARAVTARSVIDGSFLMEAAFETPCIERRSICTN